MVLALSPLRRILRNHVPSTGIAGCLAVLLLTGCARIAGLEPPVEPDDDGGSQVPAESLPPDETLPPAPPKDCGDVASSDDNCGWCGHSCRGLGCSGGLCTQEVVARRTKIDAFVTNGTELFVIDDQKPVACNAAGPPSAECQPIVDPAHVLARLQGDVIVEPNPGGGGGPGRPGGGKKGFGDDDDFGWGPDGVTVSPLAAKAIALHGERVLIADDTYHALLSCPTKGRCDAQNVGIVDARAQNGKTAALGKALAVGPSGITWTQGEQLFAARLPADGKNELPLLSRGGSDTQSTARIIAPAGIFWLAQEGLRHAPSVEVPSEKWSSREAADFAVDDHGVYVANKTGILRVARSDRRETVAAIGDFRRVEVEGGALYATRVSGGSTSIVEVRAGALLEIAVVSGAVDGLAVTKEHVYFATGGEIRRVPR
jgi:hypothetical protein